MLLVLSGLYLKENSGEHQQRRNRTNAIIGSSYSFFFAGDISIPGGESLGGGGLHLMPLQNLYSFVKVLLL